MPLIEKSSYPGPPFWQPNGHLQTIAPGILRRVRGVRYERERIATPDDDFLDIDWLRQGCKRLVITTHGLESSSEHAYVRGGAKLFSQNQWDVLAWNCRSCSGEMNRQFRMYHHGDTEDIATVVRHALAVGNYDTVVLIGYSMGANITMKYLGTAGDALPTQVKAAAVFSAPCDLESGAEVLDRPDNYIYRKRFMGALYNKLREKSRRFPGRIDLSKIKQVKRWRDFDEWFSAPICGYRDAADFYRNASARYFISGIRIPVLLTNALNDPILTPKCMPVDIARDHACFHLELPEHGGHCGFMTPGDPFSWAERRALQFCEQNT